MFKVGQKITLRINGKDIKSTLTENDVVMGKGTPYNNFAGNINFRRLCDEYRADYKTETKKRNKSSIAKLISHIITDEKQGRFLEKKEDGTFSEVDAKKALAKISQNLREQDQQKFGIVKQAIAQQRRNVAQKTAPTQNQNVVIYNTTQRRFTGSDASHQFEAYIKRCYEKMKNTNRKWDNIAVAIITKWSTAKKTPFHDGNNRIINEESLKKHVKERLLSYRNNELQNNSSYPMLLKRSRSL